MSDFPHLARAINIGAHTLKNRIVHCAILTRYVANQAPTDAFLKYHENRARGGAAMIVSETVNALRGQSGRPDYLNAHNDEGIEELSRVAERVRQHDCLLLAQFQDRGRGHYSDNRQDQPYGPSALPDDLSGIVPLPLSINQIEQMVDDFAAAALRLQKAGYNGVEISAGHGHLFHQFLSPHSNQREDAYGGDLKGRIKFVADVLSAVRQTCGAEFMIGLKLPAEDGLEDGIDLASAATIANTLVAPEAVDYAAFCWGSQADTLYWHLPDSHFPRTPYTGKTAELRQHTNGVPVMSLGRIVDPHEAENILAQDKADLIGLGRTLIADPAWSNKTLGGNSHTIRPCVSGNSCWASLVVDGRLACENNPALADDIEIDGIPHDIVDRKKIVVIGGGVTGMEAAWVAAARGHDVILFEARSDTGGGIRQVSQLPGSEGLAAIVDFQAQAAKQHGVKIETGWLADLEDIQALSPDHVILATGARMSWPEQFPPELEGSGIILTLLDLVESRSQSKAQQPGCIVVLDEHQSSAIYDAVIWLAEKFDNIFLITSQTGFAISESLINRQGILHRLRQSKVNLLASSKLTVSEEGLAEGIVEFKNIATSDRGSIENVSALTYASQRVPRLDLLPDLKAAGIVPHIIGDAQSPRLLVEAMSDGYKLGLKI
jgi:dimethylglycine catabolism A